MPPLPLHQFQKRPTHPSDQLHLLACQQAGREDPWCQEVGVPATVVSHLYLSRSRQVVGFAVVVKFRSWARHKVTERIEGEVKGVVACLVVEHFH